MSFLDVIKRSIGIDEDDKSSTYRKEKENTKTNMRASSKPRARQVENSNVSSFSRLSLENDKSTAQRRAPSRTRSRFSQLSTEIVQFQKMVRELESLVNLSGDSPETQWRSRILLRSAEEADKDIRKKIRHQEQTVCNVVDPNVRASYKKLKRDYARAHSGFETMSHQYMTQQQQAIARMGGEYGWESPEELQRRALAQQEEEFFYRAMREQESEVKKMNESMHKVNNIYEELGRIVQDQQEQIDAVEVQLNGAAATTRAGVDHLQQKFPYCGNTAQNDETPRLRTEEEFRWSMPFETMGADIKEVVQKDILGLGNDLISMTKTPSMMRATSLLQCAPPDENFDSVDTFDTNDDDSSITR